MAATHKPAAEKRGPRIGDAASLWNFTPAPGWTKEEAQILKLCLMKQGIGRWVQILETGLLPGKLIQQLNGQTQRLLGQQSLAAYTGLHVDIDAIRADNDKLVDAERKNGLVINSGPNLTKQQKMQMQEEAKAKYGLSEADIQEVDMLLHGLLGSRAAPAAAAAGDQAALPEAQAAGAGTVRGRAQREAELLARDTEGLSQEQKLNFLLHMHEKLQQAAGRLAKATAAAAAGGQQPAAAPAPRQAAAAAPPAAVPAAAAAASGGSAENEGAVANVAPMQLDAPSAGAAQQLAVAAVGKPAAGKAAGGKRKSSGGGRQARQAGGGGEADDGDWRPKPRSGAGASRGRRGGAAAAAVQAMDVDGSTTEEETEDEAEQAAAVAAAPAVAGGSAAVAAAAAAAAAAVAADVEQLVSMGFSSRQAREALEEADYNIEVACEWLVANCV